MLEILGYRGKDFGTLMCYPGNAMVIVNKGGATAAELKTLVAGIQQQVLEKFGVQIEPEPILIG
jgi:UDP-N-acetylmuramate dehydrogenase